MRAVWSQLGLPLAQPRAGQARTRPGVVLLNGEEPCSAGEMRGAPGSTWMQRKHHLSKSCSPFTALA